MTPYILDNISHQSDFKFKGVTDFAVKSGKLCQQNMIKHIQYSICGIIFQQSQLISHIAWTIEPLHQDG